MVPLGMLGVGEVAEVIGFRRDHRNGFGKRGTSCWGCHGHNNGNGANRGAHGAGKSQDATGEHRLAELGFSRGQRLEVMQNSAGIPLLLKVCDSRIALDSKVAMNIMVRRTGQ